MDSTPTNKRKGCKRSCTKSKAGSYSKAAIIRRRLPRHRRLRALRVKDPTLEKYDDAVNAFLSYCRRRRILLGNPRSIDVALSLYFTDLYEDGEPYNLASYALYGYIVLKVDLSIPEKQMFPQARMALKGWSTSSPTSSRTGADPLIWYLMADWMAGQSPAAAAALLIQLDSYARPSEVLNIARQDIIRPTSKQCKYWGIIFGNSDLDRVTKTGTQDDTVLLDSLDRDYAPKVLQLVFKACKGPSDLLFPDLTLAQYEALFRQAKSALGIRLELTPHSVRHSGPSVDALSKSRSQSEIQARGRWRTSKSILRYQKPGQMLARMGKIQQAVWDQAANALPRVLKKLQVFYKG